MYTMRMKKRGGFAAGPMVGEPRPAGGVRGLARATSCIALDTESHIRATLTTVLCVLNFSIIVSFLLSAAGSVGHEANWDTHTSRDPLRFGRCD